MSEPVEALSAEELDRLEGWVRNLPDFDRNPLTARTVRALIAQARRAPPSERAQTGGVSLDGRFDALEAVCIAHGYERAMAPTIAQSHAFVLDAEDALSAPVKPSAASSAETGGASGRLVEDNPEADATDAAHPAWWRGHSHTTVVICQMINGILDGTQDVSGFCDEPWQSTRQRIAALRPQQPPTDGEGAGS